MSAEDHLRIARLAADRSVHRAFGWLHLHELRLRQWQMEMIAIPAPPFQEGTRAQWFLERFHELGLVEAHIDSVGNVLGVLRARDGGNAEKVVLLSAHLDTVFPADTDCRPTEQGALIVAPGACDNAAGLTALLGMIAALRVAEYPLPCSILFCANVGEEGEGNLRGMRHLFVEGSHLLDSCVAAIALEGAGDATVVARALGSRRFRVTVRGPGGHSWADAAQANPIFALSEMLTSIAALPLPSTPRTTLHCGTISGGTSVNSIPQEATATLDLRSVTEMQLQQCEEQIVSALQEVLSSVNARSASREALKLTMESIGRRPAGELLESSVLLRSLRAVDRHLRIATESRVGSTDANLPLSLGIPALAIGTGGTGGGIHTLAEWYDPTGRELALRRILLLVLDTCACAGPHRSDSRQAHAAKVNSFRENPFTRNPRSIHPAGRGTVLWQRRCSLLQWPCAHRQGTRVGNARGGA